MGIISAPVQLQGIHRSWIMSSNLQITVVLCLVYVMDFRFYVRQDYYLGHFCITATRNLFVKMFISNQIITLLLSHHCWIKTNLIKYPLLMPKADIMPMRR